MLVSVALSEKMHEKIASARRFGVSVLAQDQLAASNHFAGRAAECFAPDFDLLQGLPVIRGAGVHVALVSIDPSGRRSSMVSPRAESEPL